MRIFRLLTALFMSAITANLSGQEFVEAYTKIVFYPNTATAYFGGACEGLTEDYYLISGDAYFYCNGVQIGHIESEWETGVWSTTISNSALQVNSHYEAKMQQQVLTMYYWVENGSITGDLDQLGYRNASLDKIVDIPDTTKTYIIGSNSKWVPSGVSQLIPYYTTINLSPLSTSARSTNNPEIITVGDYNLDTGGPVERGRGLDEKVSGRVQVTGNSLAPALLMGTADNLNAVIFDNPNVSGTFVSNAPYVNGILTYSVDSRTSGAFKFYLRSKWGSRWGDSNVVDFEIFDPPPVIDSITPSVWQAGTSFPVTVKGTGFCVGSLSFDDSSIQFTPEAWNWDNSVTGMVSIPRSTPAKLLSVNLTSDGKIARGRNRTNSKSVTINPIIITDAVSVSPAFQYLGESSASQLTAVVSEVDNIGGTYDISQNVAWSISPTIGTISANGLYQAPTQVINQQEIYIQATSLASSRPARAYGVARITLVPAPKKPVITAPIYVTAGYSYVATTSPQAASTTIKWTITNATITSSDTGASITFVAGASGTVGLSCVAKNAINQSSQADPVCSSIVEAPIITSFIAEKSLISMGSSTTLTAIFSNGIGLINNGVGGVNSGVPVAMQPSSTITYRLIVSNLANTTKEVFLSITVIPIPARPVMTIPQYVHPKQADNYAWVVEQNNCTYLWAINNGIITSGQASNKITFTAGDTGIVEMSCTAVNEVNVSGPTEKKTSIIGGNPIIEAIEPNNRIADATPCYSNTTIISGNWIGNEDYFRLPVSFGATITIDTKNLVNIYDSKGNCWISNLVFGVPPIPQLPDPGLSYPDFQDRGDFEVPIFYFQSISFTNNTTAEYVYISTGPCRYVEGCRYKQSYGIAIQRN